MSPTIELHPTYVSRIIKKYAESYSPPLGFQFSEDRGEWILEAPHPFKNTYLEINSPRAPAYGPYWGVSFSSLHLRECVRYGAPELATVFQRMIDTLKALKEESRDAVPHRDDYYDWGLLTLLNLRPLLTPQLPAKAILRGDRITHTDYPHMVWELDTPYNGTLSATVRGTPDDPAGSPLSLGRFEVVPPGDQPFTYSETFFAFTARGALRNLEGRYREAFTAFGQEWHWAEKLLNYATPAPVKKSQGGRRKGRK